MIGHSAGQTELGLHLVETVHLVGIDIAFLIVVGIATLTTLGELAAIADGLGPEKVAVERENAVGL